MVLSDVSIKRPVFATVLSLIVVIFGLFAFRLAAALGGADRLFRSVRLIGHAVVPLLMFVLLRTNCLFEQIRIFDYAASRFSTDDRS